MRSLALPPVQKIFAPLRLRDSARGSARHIPMLAQKNNTALLRCCHPATTAATLPPLPSPPPRFCHRRQAEGKLPLPPRCRLAAAKLPPLPPSTPRRHAAAVPLPCCRCAATVAALPPSPPLRCRRHRHRPAAVLPAPSLPIHHTTIK
jgi:hypothetical protein